MLFSYSLCSADIYYCSDRSGQTVYKDSACAGDETLVKVVAAEPPVPQAEAEEEPVNIVIEDDKPGKLIHSDNRPLVPPYKIKVNEVRIITEMDDRLVVDVIYTYEHDVPTEEVKIFVTPNHGYWSTNDIKVSRGQNVGRATIGLSESNMKKARVTRSTTDVLRISFDHYKPKKYMGSIWSETIKYHKKWRQNK